MSDYCWSVPDDREPCPRRFDWCDWHYAQAAAWAAFVHALRAALAEDTAKVLCDAAIRRIEQKLAAERERDELRARLDEANGMLTAARAGREDWRQSSDDLREKLREAEVDRAAMRDVAADQIVHWRTQAADMERERDQLKAERDQLKAERDQLKAERDQLKAERDETVRAHNSFPGAPEARDVIDYHIKRTAEAMRKESLHKRSAEHYEFKAKSLSHELSEARSESPCDNCGSLMPAMSSVEHGSERWCCRCAAESDVIDELKAELQAARMPDEVRETIFAVLLCEPQLLAWGIPNPIYSKAQAAITWLDSIAATRKDGT